MPGQPCSGAAGGGSSDTKAGRRQGPGILTGRPGRVTGWDGRPAGRPGAGSLAPRVPSPRPPLCPRAPRGAVPRLALWPIFQPLAGETDDGQSSRRQARAPLASAPAPHLLPQSEPSHGEERVSLGQKEGPLMGQLERNSWVPGAPSSGARAALSSPPQLLGNMLFEPQSLYN